MEKILKIETQILSGKPVDEEQKIMYTTKSSVEKSLADLKGLQTALEEVAKEEQEKTGDSHSHSGEIDGSEETKEHDPRADLRVPEKPVAVVEPSSAFDGRTTSEVVEKLLKAFHVLRRFENVTQKSLPDIVTILGLTLAGSIFEGQAGVEGLLEVRHAVCVCECLSCRVYRNMETYLGSRARIPSPSCCRKCVCSGSVVPAHTQQVLLQLDT